MASSVLVRPVALAGRGAPAQPNPTIRTLIRPALPCGLVTGARRAPRGRGMVRVLAERATRVEGGVKVYGKVVPTTKLKSISVTSADGARMSLAEIIGAGPTKKAVVVFLRHLAWPYCWTYSNEWSDKLPELSAAGVVGPVFITVGSRDQLNKFLELNPKVPRALSFVDDTEKFEAHAVTGFGEIGTAMPEMKFQPPGLDPIQWFKYLTNLLELTPRPKELTAQVPEGVLKLGGVFVLEGDDIIYAFAEPVPGQHAPIEDVLAAAGLTWLRHAAT